MRFRHKNLYDMRAALRWAAHIASALAALHDQTPPYVHNDVKADNIFLTDPCSNLFLSEVARVGVSDAKLGDLKPHR
jgi:serine/threonine protein kinase